MYLFSCMHYTTSLAQVTVILTKEDGMRSLGFSIAGGRGSTPAYEDVDEVRGSFMCECTSCLIVL